MTTIQEAATMYIDNTRDKCSSSSDFEQLEWTKSKCSSLVAEVDSLVELKRLICLIEENYYTESSRDLCILTGGFDQDDLEVFNGIMHILYTGEIKDAWVDCLSIGDAAEELGLPTYMVRDVYDDLNRDLP